MPRPRRRGWLIVLRQQHVELLAAILGRESSACGFISSTKALRCSGFTSNSTTIIRRLIGISSGCISRHHRRSDGAEASASAAIRGRSLDMAHDALRTILPIAGWPESGPRRSRSPAAPTRCCRRRSASARPVRPRSRRPGSRSPTCGNCAPAADRRSQSICARRSPRCAAGTICKWKRRQGLERAQPGDGHVSGQERPLELYPRQFPEPPRRRAARSSAARKTSRRCATPWRNGMRSSSKRRSSPPAAPAAWCAAWPNGAQHPQAAAIASLPLMEIVKIGDAPAEKLPEGDRPSIRHPRARPDPRAGRPDLRPHPRRARRRRA